MKKNIANARIASKGIGSLVCMKSTLGSIPAIAATLMNYLKSTNEEREGVENGGEASVATDKNSLLVGLGVGGFTATTASTSSSQGHRHRHHLLRAIIFALTQPELEEIREAIAEALNESTEYTKVHNAMRHQECFALKSTPGTHGMMDILRKAFLKNVDDIYKKADEYAEMYGMYVTVKYGSARGYFLSLPMTAASDLPNEFIQPSRTGNGKNIHCTTEEIQSLNIRAQDNVQDLLIMTHARIQEVLAVARSKYDALARVSDAIALLDLCHSFADKVTLSKEPWVRPVLLERNEIGISDENDQGAITIRKGRYGIDVADSVAADNGIADMIPNDTYCSCSTRMTVISGVNGSGKSTYLKQIAIIVVLAHCGSYVPAEQAQIPLTNRLCARMGSADDQENNISSFLKEMKETATICKGATGQSMIFLDELGRATSNEDGVAIAWSVAEHLLAKRALTFFVTHYPQMCQMSQVYDTVQNQHLHATLSEGDNANILYSHRVEPGPCAVTSNYGVEIAANCGFDRLTLEDARAIEKNIKDRLGEKKFFDKDRDLKMEVKRLKFLKAISQKVVECMENSDSIEVLRTGLQSLKNTLSEEMPHSEVERLMKKGISGS